MSSRWQILGVLAPLILVEASSYWKLSHWLQWGNEGWLSLSTGFAFIGLLLGAIVAMSLDVPMGIRRHIYLGGIWLFLVQGLANVLIAYQYALLALPVEVVTGFFGINPEAALKITAIVQGASLSIVSISFWSVLAQLLRSHWTEQQRVRERLKGIEMLLKEVSDG